MRLLVAVFPLLLAQPPADPFAKWEKEVTAIEARLKQSPPPAEPIVFAGSSSIRLWDLKKSFPELNAVNTGFGGSQMPDVTHFAPRLVLPVKPKVIVLYAGDNDLAAGRTPVQLADDFAAFAALVHKDLPKTRILFVAVKPSVKRWALIDKQKDANARVKALCEQHARLGYIDVVPATLGADGKPDPALFQADGLHLNAAGYAAWAKVVAAALK